MNIREIVVALLVIGCVAGASQAAIIDFTSGTAAEDSTSNPFTYTVDVEGTFVDVILTASSDWTGTSAFFTNWDARGEGLGFEDASGRYTSWVDNMSNPDDGTTNGDVEKVTITFAIGGTPTTVDLGATGLTVHIRDGGMLINGTSYTNDASVLQNATNVSSITFEANGGGGNNRGVLQTLEIVPEPATMGLLGLGGLGILIRRRR
jgi:hypothetical protein